MGAARHDPKIPSERGEDTEGVAALEADAAAKGGEAAPFFEAPVEDSKAPAKAAPEAVAKAAPAAGGSDIVLTEMQTNNTRDTLLLDMSVIFTQPPAEWQNACDDPAQQEAMWKAKFEEARALFPSHLDAHVVAKGHEAELMAPEVHLASLTDHSTALTTQVQIKLPRHVVKLQNAQKKGLENFQGLLNSMCKLLRNQQTTDPSNLVTENAKLKDSLTTAKAEQAQMDAANMKLQEQVAHGKQLISSLLAKLSSSEAEQAEAEAGGSWSTPAEAAPAEEEAAPSEEEAAAAAV